MQSKSAHPTTTAIANCNCCGSCLERLVVFAVFLEQQCLEEAFRYKSLSSSQEYMCGCTDFVFKKNHCIKVICVGSRCCGRWGCRLGLHARCIRDANDKKMQHPTVIMTSKDLHRRNVMEQPQRQQQFLWAFIQVSLQLLFLFCALKNARVYLPLPQFASQDHALS